MNTLLTLQRSSRFLVATIASLSLLVGCSGEVDNSDNVLPFVTGDASDDTAAPDTASDSVDSGSCDCLVPGLWFRFDSLALASIDNDPEHPVIPTLNGLWGADVEALDLNILFEVTAVTPTSVTVRGVNGTRIDGTSEICEQPSSSVEYVFPRNGCLLETSPEASFTVGGGTLMHPKTCAFDLPVQHAIPVGRAKLSGRVTETCDAIVDGFVPGGGLGEAELGKICTCLVLPGADASECGVFDPDYAGAGCAGCNSKFQPLTGLLNAFGAPPYTCVTDDGDPAACITANYTAAAMDAPNVCPGAE